MKKFLRSRWFRIPLYTTVIIFAIIGFFLTASYVAIKMKWTNEKGSIDANSRYYSDIQDKYNQSFKADTTAVAYQKHHAIHRILLLNKYHPRNAEFILEAYRSGLDEKEVMRMVKAAELELRNNTDYQKEKTLLQKELDRWPSFSRKSVFEWMNIAEWSDFKIAVVKDKKLIDSAAGLTGVEPRLIVSCLVGEQIRLFNSNREAYKKWIGPLKILSVETQFSYGVTGIKEHTAKTIESYLKQPESEYYLGKQYEVLLDFQAKDSAAINKERMDRLTSYKNHFYSYLYAAVFLKQVKMQWEKAGYPIDHRPEILATLFNVGFPQSKPKKEPRVGGSTIQIKDNSYTFGAIAYQFYYSGELFDQFPITTSKFDPVQ